MRKLSVFSYNIIGIVAAADLHLKGHTTRHVFAHTYCLTSYNK